MWKNTTTYLKILVEGWVHEGHPDLAAVSRQHPEESGEKYTNKVTHPQHTAGSCAVWWAISCLRVGCQCTHLSRQPTGKRHETDTYIGGCSRLCVAFKGTPHTA